MKKVVLVLVVVIFGSRMGLSQDQSVDSNQQLSKENINAIYNKEFTKFLNSGSESSIGSSASISTTDDILNLNVMHALEGGHILNYGIKGGVDKGIASLFTNADLVPNIKLSVGANVQLNKTVKNAPKADELHRYSYVAYESDENGNADRSKVEKFSGHWIFLDISVGRKLAKYLGKGTIQDENFDEIQITFGKKKLSNFNSKTSLYKSYGVDYTYGANIESLKKVKVESKEAVEDSDVLFILNSQDVFQGDFKSNLSSARFYYDVYKKIRSNDVLAHFNLSHETREGLKPRTSFIIGLVVPFKKIKEEKTVLNIEFFIKQSDIFSSNENSIVENLRLGVNTSFPF